MSWYQDFEEIMMDHIDEDVSVTSVTDGTLLVPLETAGLTSDTRISYWINTNNNRFSLVVMGNPALDYERDRHLISSCYIGRIDSFENSINDVSGNFIVSQILQMAGHLLSRSITEGIDGQNADPILD